jgi:hypothetical protein
MSSSSEEDPTPTAAAGGDGGGSDVHIATRGSSKTAAIGDDDDDDGDDAGGGGGDASAGAAASDRKSRVDGEDDEDEDEDEDYDVNDDDEAALERMMAFQEEQFAADAGVPAPGGRGDADSGGGPDPNVAFLGDDDEYDDGTDDDADDEGAAPRALFRHPNLNNPAAVALRRRQAAMMRDGMAGGGRRRADAGAGAARMLRALPRLRYVPASMAAALLLLHRTMRTRRQFYLAVTYLQTSKLSYVVLGNAVIAFGVGLFGAVTSVFLDGGLRPNERDSIGENIRWDVTETCLALTMFRSELDVSTALEFLVLVVMKW